jgi:hypothetical protein
MFFEGIEGDDISVNVSFKLILIKVMMTLIMIEKFLSDY